MTLPCALAALVACAACSSSGAPDGGTPPMDVWTPSLDGAVSSVQLTPRSVTIEAGTTVRYEGTAWLTTGAVRPLLPTEGVWSVSANAAVVAPGVVRGVWGGQATVRVQVGPAGAMADLAILGAPRPPPPHVLQRIDIVPSGDQRLWPGESLGFGARGQYTDTTADVTSQVTWTSSMPDIAAIDPDGTLRSFPCREGTATIQAEFMGIVSNQVTVTVFTDLRIYAITASPTEGALTLGTPQTLRVRAAANFPDGTSRDFTESLAWLTSDPGVAVVSTTAGTRGLVSPGTRAGTAEITAALDDGCRTLTSRPVLVRVSP